MFVSGRVAARAAPAQLFGRRRNRNRGHPLICNTSVYGYHQGSVKPLSVTSSQAASPARHYSSSHHIGHIKVKSRGWSTAVRVTNQNRLVKIGCLDVSTVMKSSSIAVTSTHFRNMCSSTAEQKGDNNGSVMKLWTDNLKGTESDMSGKDSVLLYMREDVLAGPKQQGAGGSDVEGRKESGLEESEDKLYPFSLNPYKYALKDKIHFLLERKIQLFINWTRVTTRSAGSRKGVLFSEKDLSPEVEESLLQYVGGSEDKCVDSEGFKALRAVLSKEFVKGERKSTPFGFYEELNYCVVYLRERGCLEGGLALVNEFCIKRAAEYEHSQSRRVGPFVEAVKGAYLSEYSGHNNPVHLVKMLHACDEPLMSTATCRFVSSREFRNSDLGLRVGFLVEYFRNFQKIQKTIRPAYSQRIYNAALKTLGNAVALPRFELTKNENWLLSHVCANEVGKNLMGFVTSANTPPNLHKNPYIWNALISFSPSVVEMGKIISLMHELEIPLGAEHMHMAIRSAASHQFLPYCVYMLIGEINLRGTVYGKSVYNHLMRQLCLGDGHFSAIMRLRNYMVTFQIPLESTTVELMTKSFTRVSEDKALCLESLEHMWKNNLCKFGGFNMNLRLRLNIVKVFRKLGSSEGARLELECLKSGSGCPLPYYCEPMTDSQKLKLCRSMLVTFCQFGEIDNVVETVKLFGDVVKGKKGENGIKALCNLALRVVEERDRAKLTSAIEKGLFF
eukprot:Nk52_evm34s2568 gene=Nk52_evmTU34s2568